MIYANENDPKAAHWLSCLPIHFDRIDSRSIVDVKGIDLNGFTQCHFFAGIAGWPLALQMAGWPTDVEVWSGSCPCQPFSAAGKRKGTKDERHLWPEFRRLIAERMPATIFGEHVASKDGREWLSVVRADLEELGYAVGAADLCAAGSSTEAEGWFAYPDGSRRFERYAVGAPHIRQRLFWVANSGGARLARRTEQPAREECQAAKRSSDIGGLVHASDGRSTVEEPRQRIGGSSDVSGLGDANSQRLKERSQRNSEPLKQGQQAPQRTDSLRSSDIGGLEHAESDGRIEGRTEPIRRLASVRLGEGFWGECDFLYCSDGKYRPVEPGLEPLVNGISCKLADGTEISKQEMSRVTALRGIGNAIVPQVAAVFIRSFMESLSD